MVQISNAVAQYSHTFTYYFFHPEIQTPARILSYIAQITSFIIGCTILIIINYLANAQQNIEDPDDQDLFEDSDESDASFDETEPDTETRKANKDRKKSTNLNDSER